MDNMRLCSFALPLVAFLMSGCGGSKSTSNETPNPTLVAAIVAMPTISPTSGNYVGAQTITLADSTPGSTIYYTTDGSTPTTASSKYTAPFLLTLSGTVKAVATASGYSGSTASSVTYSITGNLVTVTVSTHDRTKLMAAGTDVTFGLNAPSANQVLVDETQTYQTVDGFGASFTDSAAYLLQQVTPPSERQSTLNDLFTRSGSGIGLSFMRLPMGATDLARSVYSFDDLPAGQTDPTLSHFSIAHDQSSVLPLVRAAKVLNPSMKIMANPWSPPGWMKSSGSMIGGTLLPTMYTPFANYFVKYVQAYEAAGVSIDFLSLQNEPLYVPSNYPGMGMDATTQTMVMRDYVLPALTANGIRSKLFIYDHNWDNPAYPTTVLSDMGLYNSPQVAGTAWHGYAGTPGAQQTVQNSFPNKGTWQTESSGGTFISDQFKSDFLDITQVMRNSGKAYVKWGLALDEKLGPNLTQVPGYGGCGTCTPIVTVNSTTGAVTKAIEYYTLGHYSKYVLPGAQRIYSSNGITTASVAFKNTDGSKTLIVFNNASTSQTFQVQWGTQSFSYTLSPYGAATFCWSGMQTGTPSQIATNEIQASSYHTANGFQTETTSDLTGAFNLGYASDGAYASYKGVSFGPTALSTVNVRTASAGNGGTAEFHLDSLAGPLLGTVTLQVTGGYQTYQTVSTRVTGAVGTHDVYMVVRGSGGIANVNWFQFQ